MVFNHGHLSMLGTRSPKGGQSFILRHIDAVAGIMQNVAGINPTEEYVFFTSLHRRCLYHRIGTVGVNVVIFHGGSACTVHVIGDSVFLTRKETERHKGEVAVNLHIRGKCGHGFVIIEDFPSVGIGATGAGVNAFQIGSRHSLAVRHSDVGIFATPCGGVVDAHVVIRCNPFSIKNNLRSRHGGSEIDGITFAQLVRIPTSEGETFLAGRSVRIRK